MADLFNFWIQGSHDWFIKKAQLLPLGITDTHLHFFFTFIGMLIVYYFYKPIVRWLSMLRLNRLLTYLMTSFFLLFLITSFEVYQGITSSGDMEFSDIAAGSLAIICFGIILAIVHVTELIGQMLKNHKSKSI